MYNKLENKTLKIADFAYCSLSGPSINRKFQELVPHHYGIVTLEVSLRVTKWMKGLSIHQYNSQWSMITHSLSLYLILSE